MFTQHTHFPTGSAGRSSALLAAAALTAATLIVLGGCSQVVSATAPSAATPAPRSTAVGVALMQDTLVTLSTELPGRTSAPLAAEIRPQVGGIVRALRFAGGERVQAGQVLFTLDPASYQAAVDSAQAAVDKAQATVEADQLTASRKAALAATGAASQQDQQDAESALKLARADLASARAALATARLNLQRTAITSPIDGLVDVPAVTPGALVTADQATALTTVRSTARMQVDVTQSSADVLRLKADLAAGRLQRVAGDQASVKLLLEDGSTYAQTGRLSFSGVAVNTSTGAVTLRALFDNPQGLLMPGMYVRAVLQTGTASNALLVPQQAVVRDAAGAASVLVVDAQSKVSKRAIVADRAVGNRWLVSQGLSAGERVVVEGVQKVKPGDLVQVQVVSGQPGATTVAAN